MMEFLKKIFFDEQPENELKEKIPAIMPEGAILQINNGFFPNIKTSRILLASNEKCYFVERAILVNEKIKKHTEGRTRGLSFRICKGLTYRVGKYAGNPIETKIIEKTKGLIYITNKRIIFVSEENSFEKKYNSLTASTVFNDGISLQFNSKSYKFLMPNSFSLNKVLGMINNIK